MKKNKISKNWINKQNRDIYVRESRGQGYRSRSAFKLIEIDRKFHFLSKSKSLLDLGSVPGSWSQVASKKIKNGKILSVDIKEMLPISNTIFLKGDFTKLKTQNKIIHWVLLNGIGNAITRSDVSNVLIRSALSVLSK